MKKDPPTSVNQCWIRYRDNHLPNVVDAGRQKLAWTKLEPFFKKLLCDEVRPHHVRDFIDNGPGSKATKSRDIAVLRAALNWNRKNGYVETISFVERPTVHNPRNRVLDEEEIVRIIDAIDSACFQDFVAFCLYTAQRTGAVINLTWDRVDMANGIVNFNDPAMRLAERRKGRAVLPITGPLRRILERRREMRSGDYVFNLAGRPLAGVDRTFKTACRKAGVDQATLHTLRHTAATMALNNGASTEQVQKLLAHKSLTTTQQNYAHLKPEFARGAMDAIKVKI